MLQRQIFKIFPSLSVRCSSTVTTTNSNDDISPVMNNRNPRNLERLRIGYRPNGYTLEKPGKKFWHKLEIIPTNRYITARIVHFMNGTIIEASTSEWAIKKQLYKPTDTAACINLGRILARRCLQSGILEVRSDITPPAGGRIEKLIQSLENGGVTLAEPNRIRKPELWEKFRPEYPWEVIEKDSE